MSTPPALDRPDLFVVARLLEKLWREDQPLLKTRLQVAANVNYDIFRRYLMWMSKRDLVEFCDSGDGHERVKITTNGTETYRKLVGLISDLMRED